MTADIMALLGMMPRPGSPGYAEAAAALEEYVQADKQRERAHGIWRVAVQRVHAKLEELERVVNEAARQERSRS